MKNERNSNPEKGEPRVERRTAVEADTDFAKAVHHAAYRDVVVRQFGEWDEMAQNKFFEDEWNSSSHEIVLCNGEPCGYYSTEEAGENLLLKELVILPEFQGRGIGTKLLRDSLALARLKGLTATISVLKENKAAELYRRMGFENTGETETHLQMKFDPRNKLSYADRS